MHTFLSIKTNYLEILKEFSNAKSTEKVIPFSCNYCFATYNISKKELLQSINKNKTKNYCSYKCHKKSNITLLNLKCSNCTIPFKKIPSQLRKNNFCSQSCAAVYNNTHKSKGIRRSKLEIWIEKQLKIKYPTLNFIFNNKEIIGSELDIYVNDFKLAFELNGLFHYKPIYGIDKLNKIKTNDMKKLLECEKRFISLYIIDTTKQKIFSPEKSEQFLKIIENIINEKLEYREALASS